jgi:hypothetical protein
LPATGVVRARARIVSGDDNGSSGLVDAVASYFVFNFTGEPGATYQVQATDSLAPPVTWSSIGGTNTATVSGVFSFSDMDLGAIRFYRTVQITP